MKCPNCNTEFDSRFCPECGTPAPAENAPAPAAEQNTQPAQVQDDVNKYEPVNAPVNMPGDAPGSPYGAPGVPVNVPGAPYGAPGAPANAPGAPYGAPGAPVNAPGAPYGAPGAPVNAPGVPYGAPGAPVNTPGAPFGAPYGAPGAPYGAPGTQTAPNNFGNMPDPAFFPGAQPEEKKKKPIFKKWWFWVIIALVLGIIGVVAAGGGGSEGKLTISEVYDEISLQEVKVISTDYLIQDDEYKALYPDLLNAIVRNDSTKDIKNLVVAFAAWDANNLPVKIQGQFDFEGAYIMETIYDDANLAAGSTFGHDAGFAVDEVCSNIEKIMAIVVSYETFDGETWTNPVYNRWTDLVAGVTLTAEIEAAGNNMNSSSDPTPPSDEDAVEDVVEDAVEDAPAEDNNSSSASTAADIESKINAQDVKVISTMYTVQDVEFKALYPDMLQAIISNEGTHEIRDAVIAFVAWDKNNLPVKIVGSMDFSDGEYIVNVNYDDINLIPGDTYGDNSGFEVDEDCNIDTFKAIVVSYEAFDGYTWENPYYDDWCEVYGGVKYQGN